MSVEVGSAVGYLDLDIKGFLDGLKSAREAVDNGIGQIEKASENVKKSFAESVESIGEPPFHATNPPVEKAESPHPYPACHRRKHPKMRVRLWEIAWEKMTFPIPFPRPLPISRHTDVECLCSTT